MTFGSDITSQDVLGRLFKNIAFIILFSLSISTMTMARSINSTCDFDHQLWLESGCILLQKELRPGPAPSSTPSDHEPMEDDVFPMEKVISEVAEKIIAGIAGAIPEHQVSVAYSESMVDLGVLVKDQVERSSTQDDAYWNYYLSCDNWNLVFNSPPEFDKNEYIATDSNDDVQEFRSNRELIIDNLKQWYLNFEFIIVEHLKIQQIATGPARPSIEDIKLSHSISLVMFLRQLGVMGIWSNLKNQFETATQMLFGLKFASKFGSQILESSLQSVQH